MRTGQRRAHGGGDHDQAPISAEVFNAPDNGDDDRGEGENGAVTDSDHGGGEE